MIPWTPVIYTYLHSRSLPDALPSLWRVADGRIRAGAAWHGQRRTDVIARPAGDFLSAERGPSGTHQPATDDAAVADGRSKGVDPDGRDLCRLHAGGRAGAPRGGRAGDVADDPRDLFQIGRAHV